MYCLIQVYLIFYFHSGQDESAYFKKNKFGKNLIVKRINNIDIEKGFWMKGDNKNILESTDSETFGHVKSHNIKGKVLI